MTFGHDHHHHGAGHHHHGGIHHHTHHMAGIHHPHHHNIHHQHHMLHHDTFHHGAGVHHHRRHRGLGSSYIVFPSAVRASPDYYQSRLQHLKKGIICLGVFAFIFILTGALLLGILGAKGSYSMFSGIPFIFAGVFMLIVAIMTFCSYKVAMKYVSTSDATTPVGVQSIPVAGGAHPVPPPPVVNTNPIPPPGAVGMSTFGSDQTISTSGYHDETFTSAVAPPPSYDYAMKT